MSGYAGLLLAAGGGRRIGGPKALLRQDDEALVERGLAVLREAGCDPVVVVLGAAAEEVRGAADLGGATVVVNDEWASGMGSSLRLGLDAVADTDAEAVVLMLVDMPGVTVAAVRRVAALPYPDALVCASYGGRRDHPMLLGRRHWSGISTLAKLDVATRPYLLAHRSEVLAVSVDGVATDADIDTPADAEQWAVSIPGQRSPAVPPETGSVAGAEAAAEAGAPVPQGEPVRSGTG